MYVRNRSRHGLDDKLPHGKQTFGDDAQPTTTGRRDGRTTPRRRATSTRRRRYKDSAGQRHFRAGEADGRYRRTLEPGRLREHSVSRVRQEQRAWRARGRRARPGADAPSSAAKTSPSTRSERIGITFAMHSKCARARACVQIRCGCLGCFRRSASPQNRQPALLQIPQAHNDCASALEGPLDSAVRSATATRGASCANEWGSKEDSSVRRLCPF